MPKAVGETTRQLRRSTPRATHLAGIDGLRAFAAVSVLITHVGEFSITPSSGGALGTLATYGAQGLTLFFALSGFLLFLPFVSALFAGQPMPSVRRYSTNRVLRIFPAYLVIFALVFLIGTLFVHGATHSYSHSDIGRITAASVLIPNVFLVQSLVPGAIGTGIGPAWSLTAELTFYALLPLVGLLAWFLVKHGVSKLISLLVGPIAFIVIGLTTTAALGYFTRNMTAAATFNYEWGGNGSAVLARSFLAQADLFGYGMLSAIAIELLRNRGQVPRLTWWVKALLLGGIAVIVAVAVHHGGGLSTSVVGMCAAALILLTVLPSQGSTDSPNALAKFLEWTPIRYVGLISYSIYLWHQPMILWLKEQGFLLSSGGGALVVNTAIVLTIVLVLASCTYYLVEKPAMSLRGRFPARTVVMG